MSAKSTILLVDDEKRFAKSLQAILSDYNYDCHLAHTGRQAIECLRQNYYEIALLDVGLPDISGCNIAKYIKEEFQNITVIMLTGINTVETAVEAMKNGAYDFLNKPVKPERLVRTLEKAHEHSSLRNELLISEKRFRTLAEAAWEGIVIFDDEHLILEANNQFYKMFKHRQSNFPQKGFLDKIFTSVSRAKVESVLNENDTASFVVTGLCSDESKIFIEARVSATECQGKPAKVMILHDITGRIRHEREKFALEKKLAKASKLNALGLMAGAVAHDLNNILTAVVSYPDMLMMQMDEQDKYYQEIQKIQHAGKQAAAIVSDLVSVARGGVRKKTVANLNTIIQEYLDSIGHGERLQTYPNTIVQTFLQNDLHNIECSVTHIHKVLLNLVGNALEAIGEGGMVNIQTENYTLLEDFEADLFILPPGEYVQLTVSDNGPGIDPNKIEQIFTPFYTTKEKGKGGTGLGLSIVWNIVQEHKGWIEVKRLNPGTAFIIYIPSSKGEITHGKSSAFDYSLRGNNEKILIVDDQPKQNEVVAKILSLLGYRSHSVTSGEDAVVYLQKNSVDLVILDMLMGDGMNGRQTYEKILELHPGQKAIVVSGYCHAEEVENAKSLGITVFMQKPISIETLGRELQRMLVKN